MLTKSIVLVLNGNWQAINIRTPQDAFCQMAQTLPPGSISTERPRSDQVTGHEWITLPIRPQDNAM